MLPVETPVTAPVSEPTVAIAAFPLVHTPPLTPSVKDDAVPVQTGDGPLIGPGPGLTVTVVNATHPNAKV